MTNETNREKNLGMALSNAVADAVERAGAVTALVNARRRLPLSGILFAADLLVTASHGVEREEEIQVILPDGSEKSAVLAGRDRGTDLAVLRLNSPAEIAPGQLASPETAQEARVGSLVLAVGRPSTEGVQASFGMVTAMGGSLRTHGGGVLERYMVTDAVPLPGFSGGPLVDLGGGLLGINTSGLVRGSSLAIPARLALEVAQNLAQHGHIRRGYLGIRSQAVELPTQARGALEREFGAAAVSGSNAASGLLIVGVEPEGPAAGGDLMVGDILVGLNGHPVSDHDDLLTALTGDVVGHEAQAQVLRGGQLQTVKVMVGERP